MPDALRDYNLWFVEFWDKNPELFIACAFAVGGFALWRAIIDR